MNDDLRALLHATNPDNGVSWEEWEGLVRWELADCLEENGWPGAEEVRTWAPYPERARLELPIGSRLVSLSVSTHGDRKVKAANQMLSLIIDCKGGGIVYLVEVLSSHIGFTWHAGEDTQVLITDAPLFVVVSDPTGLDDPGFAVSVTAVAIGPESGAMAVANVIVAPQRFARDDLRRRIVDLLKPSESPFRQPARASSRSRPA